MLCSHLGDEGLQLVLCKFKRLLRGLNLLDESCFPQILWEPHGRGMSRGGDVLAAGGECDPEGRTVRCAPGPAETEQHTPGHSSAWIENVRTPLIVFSQIIRPPVLICFKEWTPGSPNGYMQLTTSTFVLLAR